MSDLHVLSSRKIWVPLENNPNVMSNLARRLGLSEKLAFQDIYSLTEPSLLALVPRPVYALLFLFPATETSKKCFEEEQAAQQEYTGCGPDEPVIWYKQAVGHACGLIGLLHCLSNGEAVKHITPDSDSPSRPWQGEKAELRDTRDATDSSTIVATQDTVTDGLPGQPIKPPRQRLRHPAYRTVSPLPTRIESQIPGMP